MYQWKAKLWFKCGEELTVAEVDLRDQISTPFAVRVVAASPKPDLELSDFVDEEASFKLLVKRKKALGATEHVWHGICEEMELLSVEEAGLSLYAVRIVPPLARAAHQRRRQIHRWSSVEKIVQDALQPYQTPSRTTLSSTHADWEYKVQFDESDLAFVSRLLEDEGISYFFEGSQSKLVLTDKPDSSEARSTSTHYLEHPQFQEDEDYVSRLRVVQRLRPTAFKLQDYDFQRPDFSLRDEGKTSASRTYEQNLYRLNTLFLGRDEGGTVPMGTAARWLGAARADAEVFSFTTNCVDLTPGVVFKLAEHPRYRGELDLLVTSLEIRWKPQSEEDEGALVRVTAVAKDFKKPYRPARVTPKPQALGVEPATVTGHGDMYGRVKVAFPWAKQHETCWLRVSQGWAGASYGLLTNPLVGERVLVGFLQGDPDQPIIVGRLFDAQQTVPYPLPDKETVSTWKDPASNEVKLDHEGGSELIEVHATKDLTVSVGNEHRFAVTSDEAKKVDGNVTLTVGGDMSEEVAGKLSVTSEGDLYIGNKNGKVIIEAKDLVLRTQGGAITIGMSGVKVESQTTLELKANAMAQMQAPIIKIN